MNQVPAYSKQTSITDSHRVLEVGVYFIIQARVWVVAVLAIIWYMIGM